MVSKNVKNYIFLIDATGALLSFTLTYFLWKSLDDLFGLPRNALYLICSLALGLMCFSIASHFFSLRKKSTKLVLLNVLIVLNLAYCIFIISVIYIFTEMISAFGIIYWTLEMVLISLLIFLEFATTQKLKDN